MCLYGQTYALVIIKEVCAMADICGLILASIVAAATLLYSVLQLKKEKEIITRRLWGGVFILFLIADSTMLLINILFVSKDACSQLIVIARVSLKSILFALSVVLSCVMLVRHNSSCICSKFLGVGSKNGATSTND